MKIQRHGFGLLVLLLFILAACTPTAGSLRVTIAGLPEGTNANVTVSGPGGFSQTLTASDTLNDRAPGTYTISVNGVVVAKTTVDEYYQGDGTTATVTAGSSVSAGVSYAKYGSGKLWVIEYNTNRLLGYDQAAGTPVTVDLGLPTGQKARGLALDRAGNLWVGIGPNLSGTGGAIRMYRAADLAASGSPSPAVTLTSPDLGTPRSLAFDASGNLWVANEFNHTILRFDASRLGTNYSGPADYRIVNFGGNMTTPTGLAFDASGNLWVVAFNGTNASDTSSDSPGQVLKFKASQLSGSGVYNGRAAMIIYDNAANANDTTSLDGPISLAFDASGRLWVSSKVGNFIARFDVNSPSFPADCDYPGGNQTTCTPGTGSYSGPPAVKISSNGTWEQPTGLAFDNGGNLWVSDDQPGPNVSLQQRLQWNPRLPYFSTGGTGQIIRFNAADLASSGSPAPAQTLSGMSVPLDMSFNLPPNNLPLYGRP
jgi:sugar lactone lactonase YvrE